jgi:quercetin dioxygenase-like cupin family protein
MGLFNLIDTADHLPEEWKSRILGQSGACNIKILRMNAQPYPDETHHYNEALIVISGRLCLSVDGSTIGVSAGEMYLVPAGVPHAVLPGSYGALMIVDPIGN